MRTTLRTTTAVLACLHLALPLPVLAQQNGANQNAEMRRACADENSEACRQLRNGNGARNGNRGEQPADPAANQARPAPEARQRPGQEGQQQGQQQRRQNAPAEGEAQPRRQQAPDQSSGTAARPAPEGGNEARRQNNGQGNRDNGGQADRGGNGNQNGTADRNRNPDPARAGQQGGDAEAEALRERLRQTQDQDRAPAPDAQARPGNRDAQGSDAQAPQRQRDRAPAQGDVARPAPQAPARDTTAPVRPQRAENADPAQRQRGDDAAARRPGADVPNANRRSGAERRAAEGTPPRPSAAANANSRARDVVRERITNENARSSNEDFRSAINRERRQGDGDRARDNNDDDDDGMSKLEKALLIGAGALAVGSLIQGNREVVASSDDRVVVSGSDGGYQLIKDDNALLARPGTDVQTETFDDGSTRTTVTREDGTQIVTIRDADLRVLRRTHIAPNGESYVLIDDTQQAAPVDVSTLQSYDRQTETAYDPGDEEALRRALAVNQDYDRSYSLDQVRSIAEVRTLVPAIDLDNITFESGSAAISPDEADELTALGRVIRDQIEENPRELFLIEGHTDAVGDGAYNLALSDRRAESVALALTEYFDVPPENLVVQGYGERFLKVPTEEAERLNRRATVRRITPLLQMAAAN